MHYIREHLQHYGCQTLSTAELLMLILHTEPHNDRLFTQITALLTERDGLRGLIRTDFGELCQHISTLHATQLHAVLELAKRLASMPANTHYRILCAADAAQLVMADMAHLDHEQLRVILLDIKNQVVANLLLYQGTINSSVIRVAEVFRPAITRQCAGIVVCHNHPSGDIHASDEDIEITRELVEAGKLLDIELRDHLIIGNQSYLSLRAKMGW